MKGKTYFFVVCILVVPVFNTAFTRQDDFRSGVFILSRTGHALKNHEHVQLSVASGIECGNACIMNDRCQSYNYGNTADDDGKHICQLSNSTAGSNPLDLVASDDFSYYEEPQLQPIQEKIKCRDGLCQNGGTCKETIQGYFHNCECATYYTGQYCDDSKARDCKEILNLGGTIDGIYPIDPDGQGIIPVLCDQTLDGGGWIVIQQRQKPFDTDFYMNWTTYEEGFGNTSSEFWLGNKAIHRITKSPKQLYIRLKTSDNNQGMVSYSNFTISSSSDNYRLEYGDWYTVNIGSALKNHKGKPFSTFDKDNDSNQYGNCAQLRSSGWWYGYSCGHSDLNKKIPLWDTWFDYLQTSDSKMKLR